MVFESNPYISLFIVSKISDIRSFIKLKRFDIDPNQSKIALILELIKILPSYSTDTLVS